MDQGIPRERTKKRIFSGPWRPLGFFSDIAHKASFQLYVNVGDHRPAYSVVEYERHRRSFSRHFRNPDVQSMIRNVYHESDATETSMRNWVIISIGFRYPVWCIGLTPALSGPVNAQWPQGRRWIKFSECHALVESTVACSEYKDISN